MKRAGKTRVVPGAKKAQVGRRRSPRKATQTMLFSPKRRAWQKGKPGRPPNERRNLPKAVSHRKREEIRASDVMHVTIRLVDGLPALRRRAEWQVLRGCFKAALAREGFRLCHYSVMSNHLHLIVEADDQGALARGMQSLKIRMARRLNKLWKRAGQVFSGRYYTEIIRTPRQVRQALSYVLNNARRHKLKLMEKLDRFASGGWFDGWRPSDRVDAWPDAERLVDRPGSWLLRVGWRKQKGTEDHEGLRPFAIPKGAV